MSIQIGIIGSGSIAELHVNAFSRIGATIAAVCDIESSKAERLAARFPGARATSSADALLALDSVDAVVVAVPNALHKEMAIKALRAGRDVLLEKPMALDVRECDEIIAVLRQTDRILQMGFVNRGSPASQAALRIIGDGRLGRIYHAKASVYRKRGIPGLGRWFTTRAESGGGVLIDLGVHMIDLVMYLTGRRDVARAGASCHGIFGKPLEQYAFTEMWSGPPEPAGRFDVEDWASSLMRFRDGLSFEMNVAWAANLPEGALQDGIVLLGDRGGLSFNPQGDTISLASEDHGYLCDATVHVPAANSWAASFERQARLFVDSVTSRQQPHSTAECGRAVQAVIDALYRSHAEQREVEVQVLAS